MRKLLCALAICLTAGCSKQGDGGPAAATPEASPTPRKLLILATIAPMYCFTRNVAGDLADVEMIVPPGVESKGYVPSPDELAKIMQADVIVENGFGFEDWMDRIEAQGLRPGEIRILAARGTGPGIPGLPGDPDSPPADSMPDLSGPPDPHVWLDPIMAIKEIQNIRDGLMARDPANANQYLANENQYEAALRDLDDEVGRTTVDIPKRRLLCVSDWFSYFLSRYEFPIAAVVNSPNDALAAAKANNADGVLAPTGSNTAILNETGLPVVIADPMESGPASTDFYENATRANAAALREGLLK
jgi:zinc/manganese transport system substrate-binding protein